MPDEKIIGLEENHGHSTKLMFEPGKTIAGVLPAAQWHFKTSCTTPQSMQVKFHTRITEIDVQAMSLAYTRHIFLYLFLTAPGLR